MGEANGHPPSWNTEVNMTIIEATSMIDSLKPNNYTYPDKIRWLSELDGMIKANIIDTHEGGAAVAFDGYTESTDSETALLVAAPYEDIYMKWLEAKIDYSNAEYAKYNNSKNAFNAIYTEFENYYNRHHMPIQHRLKFF
jgi:hypothetical protein